MDSVAKKSIEKMILKSIIKNKAKFVTLCYQFFNACILIIYRRKCGNNKKPYINILNFLVTL